MHKHGDAKNDRVLFVLCTHQTHIHTHIIKQKNLHDHCTEYQKKGLIKPYVEDKQKAHVKVHWKTNRMMPIFTVLKTVYWKINKMHMSNFRLNYTNKHIEDCMKI